MYVCVGIVVMLTGIDDGMSKVSFSDLKLPCIFVIIWGSYKVTITLPGVSCYRDKLVFHRETTMNSNVDYQRV